MKNSRQLSERMRRYGMKRKVTSSFAHNRSQRNRSSRNSRTHLPNSLEDWLRCESQAVRKINAPAITADIPEGESPTVLTIGHSTRPIDEFVRMLYANDVRRLVDVRTVPGSRRNPQFGSDALKSSMEAVGIDYIHMKALGGLRKPSPHSINAGWKNTSFRGYADYIQTEEFTAALEWLIKLAGEKRTAIMCAEAVPWRCHRSLVADALLAREIAVEHIMSETSRKPHRLTSFAKRTGFRITYPPEMTQPELL